LLDTNTVLRGLVSGGSAATRVLRAAEARRFVPLLSKAVLDEYRTILNDPELLDRFPHLTARTVDGTLRRLLFVGDYLRQPSVHFEFPRDRRDEHIIEAAIALRASHIVSGDNDLLALPSSQTSSGKRFRQRSKNVRVLRADEFLRQLEAAARP
jgi:putative PIN family toxin of toxin-antitoxin system